MTTPTRDRLRAPTATESRLAFEVMRLAVIPGDGIGPEVVAEGLKVLREVGARRRDHAVRPRRGALAPHR